MDASFVRWAAVIGLVGVLGLGSYGMWRQTRAIGEGRIVVAAGAAQYAELAESYRRDLERHGVKYEVRRDTEGFATLKALLEAGPGINAGFIKGGLVGSGAAASPARRPRAATPSSRSSCRSGASSTSRSGCSRAAICRFRACATSRVRRY
jgi:hypothetical protein